MHFLSRLLLLILILIPAQNLQAQTDEAGREKELDTFIEKGMNDWKLPGLSAVVVKDGKVVYLKGFGIRTLGDSAAVDADTQFGIMSTTKAMTALAIAMLVDEDKIQWDDPVTKHLPWFQMPTPYLTEQVTVRDLLRHNAGLPEADFLWARGDLNTRQILERIRGLKPAYSLRSSWEYNNVLYGAAGEVVAAASGMSWEDFISTRILKPLEMANSYATLTQSLASKDKNRSSAHFEIDNTLRIIDEVPVDPVPAAGATWSTARDMGNWLQFLLAGGQYKEKRLVSEKNFHELFSPQALVPANNFYPSTALTKPHWTAYGLGWFLQDYRGKFIAMHTGSMDGRTALIGLLPDDGLGVYVFGNADHVEIRHAIMLKVFDLYTGAPDRDWSADLQKVYADAKTKQHNTIAERAKTRIANTRPSLPLKAYAGKYTHPVWGDLVISYQNGKLKFSSGAGEQNAGFLQHWNYDTFRLTQGDGRYGWSLIQFSLAPDGSIANLAWENSDGYRFKKVVEKTK